MKELNMTPEKAEEIDKIVHALNAVLIAAGYELVWHGDETHTLELISDEYEPLEWRVENHKVYVW